MEVIKNTSIGESFYSRMSADNPYESDIMDWCNMLPMPIIRDRIEMISNIISPHVSTSDLSYAWNRIGDHLSECNIFVSWDSILIRPYIVSTLSFAPFKNSQQCVFMSATLGKSGELERVTGVDRIKYLPIVSEWDKKGIGRKFFVFPDLSFGSEKHLEIILKLHEIAKKALLLCLTIKIKNNLSGILINIYLKQKFTEPMTFQHLKKSSN